MKTTDVEDNSVKAFNFLERSEVTQEIISRKPDFFETWALLLFFVIISLLIFSTWFIQYPDIIKAEAVLTGFNAPKEIIPKQSGRMVRLFAKNNQSVKQGEIIGWIESNAETEEVLELSQCIDSVRKFVVNGRMNKIVQMLNTPFERLGELQSPWQIFITSWQIYSDYTINGFYSKRKNTLLEDISTLQKINERNRQQKDINEQGNELAKQTYEMNEKLFQQKVISAEEYRQARSSLLNKHLSLSLADANILSQENQIRDKQKEIDQLNHDILKQEQIFEQALNTLKSNVDEWLMKYVIKAPTAGKIVFARLVQENQYLEQGKLIGYVLPLDNRYYVELKIKQSNFGKVTPGLKVQLRFEAYPYQETGYVSGTLDYLSSVSIDSAFLGTVRLDHGLVTSQNKIIQFKSGLKAEGLIITREMRLLERLYYSIIKVTTLNK